MLPSSYIENPRSCRFEGQDPTEKILLLLRAHAITNLKWIIPSFLVFLLPIIIPLVISYLKLDFSFIPGKYLFAFILMNYLLLLMIIFQGFLSWYFNVYIITDKNIIDVDFNSIIYKNIDMAPLANVEDISSSMAGFTQSVFHYGDVFIQTAGATENIDLRDVYKPDRVADFILDLTNAQKKGSQLYVNSTDVHAQ